MTLSSTPTTATVQIPVSRGRWVALVDAEDAERVAAFKWLGKRKSLAGPPREFYACRMIKSDGRLLRVWMHRFILDAPPGLEVDHINGNPLDNRRSNLRLCTHSQNSINNRQAPGSSGYRGVHPRRGRYRAVLTVKGDTLYLGTFDDVVTAARVRDVAARQHFGEFAFLNFPDEGR